MYFRDKLKYYLSMTVIILAMLLLISVFIFAFFPYEPVKLNKSPFKVITKQVKAGGNLVYTLDFDKKMNIKPEIYYYLIDGTVVRLNTGSAANRPLGDQIRTLDIEIPKNTRPNHYFLQIDLVYKINALQTKYYSWVSEEFEVI